MGLGIIAVCDGLSKMGGLLVLGSDNNQPCEGSTVGLNSSAKRCTSMHAAVLESGMDNSPMYFNAFAAAVITLIKVLLPADCKLITSVVEVWDCEDLTVTAAVRLAHCK
jgi:hypothetical protein